VKGYVDLALCGLILRRVGVAVTAIDDRNGVFFETGIEIETSLART
jgi:hypothetical protein